MPQSDPKGGKTKPSLIDPTKNVLDLVNALKESSALLRASDQKYQDDMRAAETRRVDQLAQQGLVFSLEMSKVLRSNQDAAALLLATQLKEVKTDLSDRMAKQEQFMWESGGKRSVADPALERLAGEVHALVSAEKKTEGAANNSAVVLSGLFSVATLVVALAAIFLHK